ncbi:MAG: hypothetical protein ABIQ88_09835 [Chitinophagaceae bacterium]
MKYLLISAIFSIFTYNVYAQKGKKTVEEEVVFTKVEVNAGTDYAAWATYIKKASRLYASTAGIPAGSYKIKVSFVIDQYGNITAAKAKNDPGYGLAKKAELIIYQYPGVWRPANQCGRFVKSYKEQVVEFNSIATQ